MPYYSTLCRYRLMGTEDDVRRSVLLLVIGLCLAGAAWADEVGTIVFVEGFPDLVRDGRTSSEIVDFGFRVENFDYFQTDDRSSFEIELDRGSGIDATIIVDPDTQFYLEVSAFESEQTGAIELLTGSITTRARELIGTSRLEVRTETTVAGVRGTTFSVTTAVGGELLVSAEEGLVEVTYDDRQTLFASPGEAVEIVGDENRASTVRYQVGSDVVGPWRQERLERFRARAPVVLELTGRGYRRARDTFVESLMALMERRDVIDRWIEQDERSERLRPADRIARAQEAARIAADLLRVRRSARRYESILVRLDRMEPAVQSFAADVEIADGFTAADLYVEIDQERRVMAERLASVRYTLKLYETRRGGPDDE